MWVSNMHACEYNVFHRHNVFVSISYVLMWVCACLTCNCRDDVQIFHTTMRTIADLSPKGRYQKLSPKIISTAVYGNVISFWQQVRGLPK